MTPNVSSVIEETIRLQQQTNHLQLLCMALIFVSNIFIVLAVLSIRKATRINRDWSKANQEWSEALSAASVDRSPQGGDHEDGRHAKHESAVAKPDAQPQSEASE